VTFSGADITVSEVLKVIQDAGFSAELLEKQDIQSSQEVPICFSITVLLHHHGY